MLQYQVGCELDYFAYGPSTFIFNVAGCQNEYQHLITEQYTTTPALPWQEYSLAEEPNRYFRLNALAGPLRVKYSGIIEVNRPLSHPPVQGYTAPAQLPCPVIHYLYPSRYCQSDLLLNFAQGEFGQWESGYAQVAAICDWIHQKVVYLPGSSDSFTSATETLLKRVGVCRDFAHLGVALCRALNIPARFVSGYAHGLNPPDFHAWFEAYLGQDWCQFDPSRLVPSQGLVQVGVGRDAADVALATILGAVTLHRFQVLIEPLPRP